MQTRLIIAVAIALTTLIAQSVSAAPMPQPSAHTKGTATGKPTGPLKPGEYWWNPKVSPAGPVVLLVSMPLQTMHVYRNGVLVGRTSISSGSEGHRTPTGVFTILEKKQTHRSKKYNNAPMPNMQRLTWSGIAMHSGNLPGYPASHGCVRMPYDFSTLVFGITGNGGTVVIGDDTKAQPHFAANPGVMLAPKDFTPEMLTPRCSGIIHYLLDRCVFRMSDAQVRPAAYLSIGAGLRTPASRSKVLSTTGGAFSQFYVQCPWTKTPTMSQSGNGSNPSSRC